MIQRRAKKVGLGEKISCHTFRATGITAYLRHGGNLENAQKIAAQRSGVLLGDTEKYLKIAFSSELDST